MIALPVEDGLLALQRSFAEAIFSHDAPIPMTVRAASDDARMSRFGVYRNNVVAGLIRAMGSRYPVCRKLLWPETFDRVAGLYILSEPPRSPVLLRYGDGFPQFLRRIGEGAATDYVSDIAALETARVRAYHAADAMPLPADAFRSISEEALPGLRMQLHPSVALLSSRFPVVSAWEALVCNEDAGPVAWRAESALVARPQDDVLVQVLPPGGFAFFSAIAEGRTIADAVTRAITAHGGFDLAACFQAMVSGGMVVGFSSAG